jgi:hypothetical protein
MSATATTPTAAEPQLTVTLQEVVGQVSGKPHSATGRRYQSVIGRTIRAKNYRHTCIRWLGIPVRFRVVAVRDLQAAPLTDAEFIERWQDPISRFALISIIGHWFWSAGLAANKEVPELRFCLVDTKTGRIRWRSAETWGPSLAARTDMKHLLRNWPYEHIPGSRIGVIPVSNPKATT